jgi:hypothetical protein
LSSDLTVSCRLWCDTSSGSHQHEPTEVRTAPALRLVIHNVSCLPRVVVAPNHIIGLRSNGNRMSDQLWEDFAFGILLHPVVVLLLTICKLLLYRFIIPTAKACLGDSTGAVLAGCGFFAGFALCAGFPCRVPFCFKALIGGTAASATTINPVKPFVFMSSQMITQVKRQFQYGIFFEDWSDEVLR